MMIPRLESARFFDAHLARTLAQARRYGRRAALLVVSAESGPEDPRLAIRRAALSLLGLLRDSDLATLQGSELWVLLPETDRLGALLLHQRILRHVPEAGSLRIGSAAFPEDGSDAESLLALGRRRAEASVDALASTHELRPLGFWECLRRLLGDAPHARPALSPALLRSAMREAILELSRASTVRGIAILGCGTAEEDVLDALPAHRLSGRLVVAHPSGETGPPHPSVTYVPLEEERLARYGFVLFLSGHASYVMVRDQVENVPGMHSTELGLVSHLVSEFREAYGLREGIG